MSQQEKKKKTDTNSPAHLDVVFTSEQNGAGADSYLRLLQSHLTWMWLLIEPFSVPGKSKMLSSLNRFFDSRKKRCSSGNATPVMSVVTNLCKLPHILKPKMNRNHKFVWTVRQMYWKMENTTACFGKRLAVKHPWFGVNGRQRSKIPAWFFKCKASLWWRAVWNASGRLFTSINSSFICRLKCLRIVWSLLP